MNRPGQEYRGFLVAALAICLSVLLFSPLAWLIYRFTPEPQPNLTLLSQLAVEAGDIRPEPAEKLCFFASLLFFPLAIPGLILAISSYLKRDEFLESFERIASVLVWIYLAGLLLGSDMIHLNSWYLKSTVLGLDLPYRLAAVLVVAAVWKWWKPPGQPVARLARALLVVFVLLAMGLTCFLHTNDPYMEHSHLNAVFYSMVQLYEGRILLYDFYNQYGLYPYFLLPWFRLIGLSVETFSITMGLLAMASFFCILRVLGRVCRSRVVVLLGFLACINFNYFYMKQIQVEDHAVSYLDPYFQYWPIRLLFPSLMLWLLTLYFESGRKLHYWSGMLLFSAGCFWNLDSGVPAWGTWVLALGYAEFLRPIPRFRSLRNALTHLLTALASLLLIAGLFELGSQLVFSEWVSLAGMIQIHRVFYGIGFFMLPMELPHSWILVALLYFAGLAFAFQALRSGGDELRPKLVFAVSIVGFGCFAYFQGRSHDWVLPLASWPATLLAIIAVDELVQRQMLRRPLAGAIFWVLAALMLNYALSLPLALKAITPYIQNRLVGRPTEPAGHMMHEEIDFLENRHQSYPERMVILSNHASVLHLLTASQFLTFDSLVEMFRFEEWSQLAATIESENSPLIMVGFDFMREDQKRPWRRLVVDALARHYHCIAASQNRRLRIYAPNQGRTYYGPD